MVAVFKHSFGGVYTHGADILVDPHTDFRLEQTVQMGAVIADGFGDMLCGKALSGVLILIASRTGTESRFARRNLRIRTA